MNPIFQPNSFGMGARKMKRPPRWRPLANSGDNLCLLYHHFLCSALIFLTACAYELP